MSCKSSRVSFRLLVGLTAVGLASTALASAATADEHEGKEGQEGTVVATGLFNPRHLTVAPNGDVYIAESGAAGGDCIELLTGNPEDPEETFEVCAGDSGSITRLSHRGVQERVVTGLPSVSAAEGDFAGPSDVTIRGNQLMVTIGMGGPPAARDLFTDTHGDFYAGLGTVQKAKMTGPRTTVGTAADLAQFEADHNPHPAYLDTNPNAIVADGNGWLLADAGGNDVMRLDNKGNLSLIATFDDVLVDAPPFVLPDLPPGVTQIPMEAVPTSIERGPDGAIYVSQLTGFPFPVGMSSIWRIGADGVPEQWATGLTNVTDLTFDDDGNLYAVQIADDGLMGDNSLMDGSLLRVGPGDGNSEVIATGMFAAYGVATYKDYAYVTTGAVTPGGGAVVRFDIG